MRTKRWKKLTVYNYNNVEKPLKCPEIKGIATF